MVEGCHGKGLEWLVPSDALDTIKKWVDAYNIPTNQERQLCDSPQLKDVCIRVQCVCVCVCVCVCC